MPASQPSLLFLAKLYPDKQCFKNELPADLQTCHVNTLIGAKWSETVQQTPYAYPTPISILYPSIYIHYVMSIALQCPYFAVAQSMLTNIHALVLR